MTGRVSAHPNEDRLLELAYGEAPAAEARTLRQHVEGCTRCRDVLQGIAEVRSAVRSVPPDPAPERGLESLLAYGEQAAARARSRKGSLRLVGLLSVAAAVALAWVLLPISPRERRESPDMLARADAPARGQAEPSFAERKLEAPAPSAPVAEEKRKADQAHKEASGAIVAMAPKTAERQKDAAKVAAAESEAPSTPPSPPAAVAMSKRAAQKTGTASEASVDKKQRMNGAEIAAAAAPAALGEDSKPAGAMAGDVAQGAALGKAGSALGTAGSATGTATATVQPLRPADRPPKAARLEQVRREVVQAAGDHRKSLLLEQCRLEAELQMGPAAVQTCSQVAREFPGTPEAKQATELASGFSVQLPPR
jgi:hypothetical protein